jgi:tetratricopeptide (TPR) repeat protein
VCKAVQLLTSGDAQAALKSGEYRKTLDLLHEVELLCREDGESSTSGGGSREEGCGRIKLWARGSAARFSGDAHMRLGSLTAAAASFKAALQAAEQLGEQAMIAFAFTGLANIANRQQAEPQTILRLLDAAMAAADAAHTVDKAESDRAKSAIHSALGRLHCEMGRSREGIEQLQKAVALREKLGDVYYTSVAQVNLAGTYLCNGQEERAMAAYEVRNPRCSRHAIRAPPTPHPHPVWWLGLEPTNVQSNHMHLGSDRVRVRWIVRLLPASRRSSVMLHH